MDMAPTTAKRPRAAVSPFLVNDDAFLSTYGNALLLANKPGKGGRALAGRRTYQYAARWPRLTAQMRASPGQSLMW